MSLETSTLPNNILALNKAKNRKNTSCRCPQVASNCDLSSNKDSLPKQWFAIRVTYGRELKLKSYLDEIEVENFVPMVLKTGIRTTSKKIKEEKKLVPAIHNLIFIHTSKDIIAELKAKLEYKLPMRYIMDKAANRPITVPLKQMEDFIRVYTSQEETILLNAENFTMKKGEKVRIIEGPFAGVEGEIFRIKKNKKVVITLEGFLAVAIAFVPSAFLERVDG